MPETLTDKAIRCVDCGRDFIWAARDQEFYQRKNLSQPKRCKPCRENHKREKEARADSRRR